MTEETIFAEALEKKTPSDRTAYLDEACAGDVVLRRRMETLLNSHDVEDSFLGKPAIQCAAEELADQAGSRDTQDDLPGDGGDEALDFLVPSDKPGTLGRLAHYDILEVIGKGGMGIVLRGFDEQLHRVVAIKVMAAQLATNATARKRFAREAQAQAAVSHDHIVTIHAVEAESPLPYLVMQYIAGMSLQERLDKSGALQLHEILRIGMQTAAGLAAAHSQGLVHRDIKPANILLENGVERVKVTDFGLARAATEASLTQSGVVAGTPQYMSPEQAEGKTIDQRTDLFSLGSVLYAMCTGRAPFRASGSMAVLKRVCEQTPTPIRETNAEIPDWLVAIIDKLHAKDPAQRYQSATEVAELLGRHLAQVQHPSVVGQVSNLPQETKTDRKPALRRSRWAAAAAVLLCLLAGLSLTEATGVTNVRATVIRIFTPDGTLVVEIDDPGVKVTIEGDGGLVITGAGLEEIRLRPGSYKVFADKDGKKILLDRELVSISKNGREVVRVKLEAPPVVAKADKGAFVVLGGKGVEVGKFDTLVVAVKRASSGDTIEIRGNGPFATDHVDLGSKALTIRAGAGYAPVIRPSAAAVKANAYLLRTDGALTLEGLELHHEGLPETSDFRGLIGSAAAPLYVTNCKLVVNPGKFTPPQTWAVSADGSLRGQIRNCHIVSPGNGVLLWPTPRMQWTVHNCLITAGVGNEGGTLCLLLQPDTESSPEMKLRLTRNTLAGDVVMVVGGPGDALAERLRAAKPVVPSLIEAEENICQARCLFSLNSGGTAKSPDGLPVEEQRRFLPELIRWQERSNVYGLGEEPFLNLHAVPRTRLLKDLAEWNQFWGLKDTGSVQGAVRLRGNPKDMIATAPEAITPDDFRLRPDSAGYRAGKDGKDLGADVDLVGPGPAYERWKKTPEYQQWLKDTKQVMKAEPPKAEPKAFVLLGGKGVTERKFETLAEAVLTASDGDTIEVRGNGPFITDHIEIKHPLTIRAGAGFRPVITDTPDTPGLDGGVLLGAYAPLRLEGLEVHCTSRAYVILGGEAPVAVANCRFLFQNGRGTVCLGSSAGGVVRNCELLSTRGAALALKCNPDTNFTIANCVLVGHNNIEDFDVSSSAAVRFTGNTFVTTSMPTAFLHIMYMPRGQASQPPSKQIRLFVSDNVIESERGVFDLLQPSGFKPFLTAAEAEQWLPRRIEWREERNIYRTGGPLLGLGIQAGPDLAPSRGKDLADWARFWGLKDTGSSQGVIRFHGGDLRAKAIADAAKLTPADFRLRPDSAGYKAGKDGKDLGADVDLVGPGPAYERWKKTPEYQQWLKDTKQVK